MDKDKALDLALEALESVLANHNGAPVLPWIEARDAIKQARSAPVQEPAIKQGWDVDTLLDKPAAPVQDLPFGVGGGLVAIKTLLSRDPCVHANTAIEMIDAILSAPAAQRQWVGLTNDEINDIRASFRGRFLETSEFAEQVQLATEAKLKEKNT